MNNIIKNLKLLLDDDSISFAYLFGSYVRGDYSKNSDLDIAIYISNNYDIFDTKLKVHHNLEISLKKKIDLIILNKVKSYTLLKDILDTNILLKDSKDDCRVMFELNKNHEILDFQVFQRMLNVA